MTKEEYDYIVSVKDTGTPLERIQAAATLAVFPEYTSRHDVNSGFEIISKSIRSKLKEIMLENKILTPEEIKPTKDLQFYSLKEYMRMLGYEWGKEIALFDEPNYFISYDYKNKHRRCISFSTAVDLYNGRHVDSHGKGYNYPFDFDPYSIRRAESAKIVKGIKLQLSKKTGYIKTQNDIVEFVKPEYYQMFINSPKYFPF